MLKRYGEQVTIIHRTPSGKFTKKNQPIYNEDEIETLCMFNNSGGRKSNWNDALVNQYDAKASFSLEDAQYLNGESLLRIDITDEFSLTYQMNPPLKKRTHWEVLLRSKDV
jgi:hypothetical protein